MIDTVILRLHGRRKYRNVIKILDNTNSKGYTTSLAKVDKEEMAKLRAQGITKPSEMFSILKRNRTGEFIAKTKVAKHLSASNHYFFAYMENAVCDYIEFNFSIPKYKYGSNVLMFVDHLGERDFAFHNCWHLEHNIRRAFVKFMRFLQAFFKHEFPLVDIYLEDVEINRIDVCFNQLFKSKSEALKYLEYQKRKTKKYTREGKEGLKEYATSLMYVTKRYSAKIYHKGSEYGVNDCKEHLKINKEKRRQYFKTEEYQTFADKMLRYELTIRNGMLNYLYKSTLFRATCPFWKKYSALYQQVEAAKQRNHRIADAVGKLPEDQREAYRKEHPYEKIDKEAKQVHKAVLKVINKSPKFTLAVGHEDEVYNKHTVDYDSDRAVFSKELLELCLDKLVEFMKEFQIRELPEEGKVEKLIDHYNLHHRRAKLPKREMQGFYADLLRFGSFKETARMTYLSRATMYRYKERFKKIGITDNCLIPMTPDGIPGAELDLREYHHHHQFNPHFLTKNGVLEIL